LCDSFRPTVGLLQELRSGEELQLDLSHITELKLKPACTFGAWMKPMFHSKLKRLEIFVRNPIGLGAFLNGVKFPELQKLHHLHIPSHATGVSCFKSLQIIHALWVDR